MFGTNERTIMKPNGTNNCRTNPTTRKNGWTLCRADLQTHCRTSGNATVRTHGSGHIGTDPRQIRWTNQKVEQTVERLKKTNLGTNGKTNSPTNLHGKTFCRTDDQTNIETNCTTLPNGKTNGNIHIKTQKKRKSLHENVQLDSRHENP